MIQDLILIKGSNRIDGCDLDGNTFERMSLRHCASSSLSGMVNFFFFLDESSPLRAFFGLFHADSSQKEPEKLLTFPLFRKINASYAKSTLSTHKRVLPVGRIGHCVRCCSSLNLICGFHGA